jgi:DNA modification methylase
MDLRLLHGDCLKILPTLDAQKIDAVITDPPYPDYHVDKYGFEDISFLGNYKCRQFVFWSAKAGFPLDYTAIHIWDKKVGAGSQYERIFERNGGAAYRVFRHYLINSTVAASFAKDVFTGHPSQKPIQLMTELIEKFTKEGDVILDPFMGSGSTGVACAKLGRNFIGIEKKREYFDIAERRIGEAQMQTVMEFA